MEDGVLFGDLSLVLWSGLASWGVTNLLYSWKPKLFSKGKLEAKKDVPVARPSYLWNTQELVEIFSQYDLVESITTELNDDEYSSPTLVLHFRDSDDKLYITGIATDHKVMNGHVVEINTVDMCDEFGHDCVKSIPNKGTATLFMLAEVYFRTRGIQLAQ